MARVPKRLLNDACFDERSDAFPIVSAKESAGGKATVITAVLIDGETTLFSEAATHGRSPLEQGIEWVTDPSEVPNGRRVFVVWLYVKPDRVSREYGYHGAVAVDMYIDDATKRGYKRLGHHAKELGRTLQGAVDLSLLDAAAKERLKEALGQYPDVLEHANPELRRELGLES